MLTAMIGLMAGFIHVLAGPDHLAAVAPLAVQKKQKTWRLGFQWGVGHTGGVLIVGFAAILFRDILPIDSLSEYSERLVGVTLVAIGIWALHKAFKTRIHVHPHSHDGHPHAHIHVHTPSEEHHTPIAHQHTHAALAVGTLHGLAGSAHILGIIPALTLPSTEQAISYMIAFGIGTILGMVTFSTLIGFLVTRYATSNLIVYRSITIACAIGAIAVGGYWIIL